MNQPTSQYPENNYLQRIWFSGKNKKTALAQIKAAKFNLWIEPKFILHTSESLDEGTLWVWRTLCKGYRGYHEGGIERYVY